MNDLSLYLLDLVENSINAKATLIEVTLREQTNLNLLELIIEDNGKGMDEETLKKVLDPFFTTRTTRRVGLGLPFIKMAAEDAGGYLSIESKPKAGTRLYVRFQADHINTPPFGDLASSIYSISIHQEIGGFIYHYIKNEQQFHYDLSEIKSILNGVPLTDGNVMKFIKEYIKENMESLRGGTL